ncbi:MAG: hypothetical protein SGBAC_006714 [Bacillariaceae sp.]
MFRQAMRSLRRTTIKGVLAVGAIEVTTHLPSEGRSSELYHYACDELSMPVIRRVLDPEDAHHLALVVAQLGLAPTYRPTAPEQRIDWSLPNLWKEEDDDDDDDDDESTTSTLAPPNCIGLAAGFDKDAVAIQPLFDMGFGFLEIGSVCLKAQPGNPKPRMFRLVPDQGVINRYGFNSQGADAVEANLKAYRSGSIDDQTTDEKEVSMLSDVTKYLQRYGLDKLLPTWSSTQASPGLLGVNLGKNKDATTPTEDYRTLIQQLGPYADYLVINVSCPNVDMKNLGKSTDAMEALLLACQEERNNVLQKQQGSKKKIPLLVKLSPDLTDEELQDICACLLKIKIDGIIMGNTTSTRPNGLLSSSAIVAEQGGLSGKPLKEKSTECIRKVYQWTNGSIPIIGVGGISTGNDVYQKLKAGASMVQVYSGMVYRGPGMVSKLRHELSERMLQDGYRRLDDVIGLDHEKLYWKRKNYKFNA